MPLEIQVKNHEKTFIVLQDGEIIEIEYFKKQNGNCILAFKFPPIVNVYRQELWDRIKREEL